jgi:hypothetical protein
MATAVRVSDSLVEKARVRAKVLHRSVSGQIEFWAKIGQLAEENPDIPHGFLIDILVSREEAEAGDLSEYVFGEGKEK